MRTRAGLPASAPLPASLQTLALRLDPVRYLSWCRARLGPRFSVHVLDMSPLVFLTDPHEIETVLAAPPTALPAGPGAGLIAPLIGKQSFILSDGPARGGVRRAASTELRRGESSRHTQAVEALVREEIGSWPLGAPIAVYPRLCGLTLRVILRVLLGEDAALAQLEGMLVGMLEFANSFVIQVPRLRHAPIWRANWKRFLRLRQEARQELGHIVARRRRDPPSRPGVPEMLAGGCQPDICEDEKVIDDLLSLVVAGHETTAAALAWALLLLAHHPEAQRRLAEEIDAKESTRYLNATIQETLRRAPVFLAAIPRVVTEAIQVGPTEYLPPTQLLAATHLMHNDPEFYAEPDVFRPERFLSRGPPSLVWKPWGGGRRRCLGQHLAELEMQVVLRQVLASREVVPLEKRIERARWRSVIAVPYRGARLALRVRA